MFKSQRGMVLISALVILIIISIIALAVGQSSMRNQQMSSSRADQLQGQTQALSAMNRADFEFRETIVNNVSLLTPGVPGSITTSMDTYNWWLTDSNWNNTNTHSFAELHAQTGSDPRYRIEYRESIQVNSNVEEKQIRRFYRVTSRANGPGSARSLLRAYFIFNTYEDATR